MFVTIMMIVGFLFIGEQFIYHLDGFYESYYRVNFTFVDVSENTTNEEIIDEFLETAHKYEVDFFVVDSEIVSDSKKVITIYGTPSGNKSIQEREFSSGVYSSLVSGRTQVQFKSIKEITDIRAFQHFYFIGGEEAFENIVDFSKKLIDKYSGGYPRIHGSNSGLYLNLSYIWCSIFLMMLIATFYEVLVKKKELIVRTIMGYNLTIFLWKTIVSDFLITGAIFIIVPLCIGMYTNVFFRFDFVGMLYGGYVIVNMAVYSLILQIDLKKDLANTRNTGVFICVTYVIKVITLFVVIFILSGNMILLVQGVNYWNQRQFFETHKDYDYYQLSYKNSNLSRSFEDSDYVMQKFHKEFEEESLMYIDLSGNLGLEYPILLVNSNALKEIEEMNPKMFKDEVEFKEGKVYYLVPEELSNDEVTIDLGEEVYDFYSYKKNTTKELIVYDKLDIVGVNKFKNIFRSFEHHNPLIIVDNTELDISYNESSRQIYYEYDVMYNLPEEAFYEFVQRNNLNKQIVKKTNVYELYEQNWQVIKRSLKLVSVLSILLLVTEIFITFFVIRLDYRSNAMLYVIKKLLGYSSINRNKRILIVSGASVSICIVIAVIVNVIANKNYGIYLCISACVIFGLEILYIYGVIKHIESQNIVRVLKRGKI